jgi:hypothetical protein
MLGLNNLLSSYVSGSSKHLICSFFSRAHNRVCVDASLSIATIMMQETPMNKMSPIQPYYMTGIVIFLFGFGVFINVMATKAFWLGTCKESNDTKESVQLTSVRLQHQSAPLHHPDNKIIIDVGLPRSGTNSFITLMTALFPDEPKHKFIHQYNKFSAYNLAEFVALGNISSPENPILHLLTDDSLSHPGSTGDSENTTVVTKNTTRLLRVMADYPAFFLAPKAMDFPNVYWVQVTRDVEDLIDSTLYMIQRWAKERCKCPQAPYCYDTDRWMIMDRLYYNRYKILEYFCNNNKNASAIPRRLIRLLVTTFEEQTANYLKDHPHYLHFRLEEDTDTKLQKLSTFLGLGKVPNITIADSEFHKNKRTFQVPSL